MQQRPIVDVLRDHTERLMDLEGVVGTGQGLADGKPCVKVLVIKKTAHLLKHLPTVIEGYAVEVKVTGVIRAMETP